MKMLIGAKMSDRTGPKGTPTSDKKVNNPPPPPMHGYEPPPPLSHEDAGWRKDGRQRQPQGNSYLGEEGQTALHRTRGLRALLPRRAREEQDGQRQERSRVGLHGACVPGVRGSTHRPQAGQQGCWASVSCSLDMQSWGPQTRRWWWWSS